ncbi:diguanylate cyclase [Alteromonas sp. ASW11-36]|uniref:diguanylate cyclase n=1 Tax=Alteromonas arenosi TaxID=3055817 RepID=A0ABT7T1L4_9ALTE|nr:diguanylate cyclase [Alteromonas sp. ASW11-36]MDM7861689.1 diguanylate cyclase [Alteromonas sp. ASW11-36]
MLIKKLNDYRASVLVVDDEPINTEILANALVQKYWVHQAASGKQALDFVRKRPVDLILLDIRMPDMDGYEVLRELKRDASTDSIPVIFVTGQDSTEDELRGLKLGAVDYIRKPYKIPLALARINVHIDLKVKSDILAHVASADGLTGIANRRTFDESLVSIHEHCMGERSNYGVVLIDIDFFKQYNDTYGHAQGDDALKSVASTLYSVAQRTDDIVARVGGEEFALILPNVDKKALQALCEKIHRAIAALGIEHKASEVSNRLTVSVGGVLCAPQAGNSPSVIYQQADQALYAAKNQGRDTTVMGED